MTNRVCRWPDSPSPHYVCLTDLHAPAVDFKYDLSPISIIASQKSMPTYHFLTSTCAIIGGVFTVIGLVESVIHVTQQQLSKKQI